VNGARTARRRGGAWHGANRGLLGRGASMGKARGPRAARDLMRRGVGRRTGAGAGAVSRRRARPARSYFAEPQFQHDLLQKFVLKCIK
jgi:hypothetical protein